MLNNIEKEKNRYIVEIVEYIEDYSTEGSIVVKTIEGTEIGKISSFATEMEIQNIVKNNIDRFSKKKIYLNKDQEKLFVEKVE